MSQVQHILQTTADYVESTIRRTSTPDGLKAVKYVYSNSEIDAVGDTAYVNTYFVANERLGDWSVGTQHGRALYRSTCPPRRSHVTSVPSRCWWRTPALRGDAGSTTSKTAGEYLTSRCAAAVGATNRASALAWLAFGARGRGVGGRDDLRDGKIAAAKRIWTLCKQRQESVTVSENIALLRSAPSQGRL
jgi:hypothetical protein